MKKVLLILVVLCNYVLAQEQINWNNMLGVNGANFKTITQKVDNYFATQNKLEDEFTEGGPLSIENYSRWKNFWQYRVGDGTIPNAGVFNPSLQTLATPICNSSLNSDWKCLGPDGMQITTSNLGIVTQLTFDPDDLNTLYIGTLCSGVWMTHYAQNANPDWISLQDQNGFPGMGVSNILVLPSGGASQKRIFVGTSPNYGIGVIESTDGGIHWNQMQNLNLGNEPVLQLAIEPGTTPRFLYVLTPLNLIRVDLTTGPTYQTLNLFSFTPANCQCLSPGIYWNLKQICIDPLNNSIIYFTTTGFDESGKVFPNCTNTGCRVFKMNISTLITTDITPQVVIGVFDIKERNIAMNISTTIGHNLIAVFNRKSNSNYTTQIFNGTTWSAPKIGPQSGYGSYFSDLQINSLNNDVMYLNGAVLLKTIDGGLNWLAASTYSPSTRKYHADVRKELIKTSSADGLTDELWLGHDGGVSSGTGNLTNVNNINIYNKNGSGFIASEFYGVDVSELNRNTIVGGVQDNGQLNMINKVWYSVPGGDGFQPIVYDYSVLTGIGSVYFGEVSSGSGSGWSTVDNAFNFSQNGQNYSYLLIPGSVVPTVIGIAGQNTVTVSSTTGIVPGEMFFLGIGSDFGNPVISISGNTITLGRNLIYNYNSVNSKAFGWFSMENRPLKRFNNKVYIGYNDLYEGQPDLTLPISSPDFGKINSWTDAAHPDLNYLTNIGQIGVKDFELTVDPLNTSKTVGYILYPKIDWSNPSTLVGFLYKNLGDITVQSSWVDISDQISIAGNRILAGTGLGITALAIKPTDPKTLWATISGLGSIHVIKTIDGGVNWTNESAGLPNFPANCIVYEKGSNDVLFVGTDRGIFYRNASMTSWECFYNNLPSCIVMNLKINYCSQQLVAATYGRGIWTSRIPPLPAETLSTGLTTWNQPKNLYHDVIVPTNSTLIINTDLNIGSGKRITVLEGGTLQINGGILHNVCGDMWDGIYAKTGSNVRASSAVIQNAYKAFSFEDQSTFTINLNIFKENFISIYVGNNTTRSSVTGYIVGNTFDCGLPLPPYFGTTPPVIPPSTISLCGIYAENTDYLAIGRSNINIKNTFSNMTMGIYSKGSNLDVTNAHFENIFQHSPYQIIFSGSAIYSIGNGNYNINVTGVNNNLDIKNCTHGIYINDQNFSISGCKINGVKTGIQVNFCDLKRGYITSNIIYSLDRGINLHHNSNAKYINVSDNEIHVCDPTDVHFTTTRLEAFGIGVWEQHDAASTIPHINLILNNIYVNYGGWGIVMIGSDHVAANGNHINLLYDNNDPQNPNERIRAFSIFDCSASYINDNIINGSNATVNSTQFGFEISTNANATTYLTCNTANNTLRNFYFGGGTNSVQLFGSHIGNGYEGLHIGSSCAIGPQIHSGNCFNGTYGNPLGAAINMNTTNVLGSQFKVNPGCYFPTNNQSSLNWFSLDFTAPEWNCSILQCDPCIEHIKKIDDLIVEDALDVAEFTEETQWEGNKYLYEKLTKYPDLMTSKPLYENFYNSFANTNINNLVQIGFDLISINQISSTNRFQYNLNDSIIQSGLDSISSLNKLLNETSNLSLQATLKNQINSININIRALTTNNNIILNAFKQSRSSQADIIKNKNNAISTSLEIENNIKKVNETYLSTFAKGINEFTDQQKLILYNIAIQCPYSGGPGVYQARSLYSMIDSHLVYNDIEHCSLLGYYRLNSKSSGSTSYNCSIIPNPVKDEAKIVYDLPADSKGICYIYDNTGSIVNYFTLIPNSVSSNIYTSSFKSGIYHFQIYSDVKFIGSGNFAVMK